MGLGTKDLKQLNGMINFFDGVKLYAFEGFGFSVYAFREKEVMSDKHFHLGFAVSDFSQVKYETS